MKTIFKLIIALPIICSFVIAIAFIVAGIIQTYKGLLGILQGKLHTDSLPGLKLFEALDLFLFSLLFVIFALGFSKLFMPPSKLSKALDGITPQWFRDIDFSGLKLLLWETILTTIIIIFIGQILKEIGQLSWELLIIPTSVLILSISIFFLKKSEKKEGINDSQPWDNSDKG